MDKIKAIINLKIEGNFELAYDESKEEFIDRINDIYQASCGNEWLQKQDLDITVGIKVILNQH